MDLLAREREKELMYRLYTPKPLESEVDILGELLKSADKNELYKRIFELLEEIK